jgi:hypothetical protein
MPPFQWREEPGSHPSLLAIRRGRDEHGWGLSLKCPTGTAWPFFPMSSPSAIRYSGDGCGYRLAASRIGITPRHDFGFSVLLNSLATILRQHEQPQRGGKAAVLPVCIDHRDEQVKTDLSLGGD